MKYILVALIFVLAGVLWLLLPEREGLENPLPYTDQGCWKDQGNRALNGGPQQYGYTVQTCYEYAKSAGSDTFALQDNGWCVTSKAGDDYKKYGMAEGACAPLGSAWINHVFTVNPPAPAAPPPPAAPAPPACWGNLVDAHSGSFISQAGENSGMGALVTGPKYTTSADAQAACASDSTCTGVMKTKIPTGVGQQSELGYIKYTGSPDIVSRPGMMDIPVGEITFLPKIPCVSSAPPPPPPQPTASSNETLMGTLIGLLQQDITSRASLLNTANNPNVPVGSLLTQSTVDPNWQPAVNGTIPGPSATSMSMGRGPYDEIPKSSLVPCTCPTYSMSCPIHVGSQPSSQVPGDTASALSKAQDQYDLMRPFTNTDRDVPGFLNTFSAFG